MSSLRTRNSTQNGKQHSSKKKSVMSGTAPGWIIPGLFLPERSLYVRKNEEKIRWKEFLPYYLLALPGVIYMNLQQLPADVRRNYRLLKT